MHDSTPVYPGALNDLLDELFNRNLSSFVDLLNKPSIKEVATEKQRTLNQGAAPAFSDQVFAMGDSRWGRLCMRQACTRHTPYTSRRGLWRARPSAIPLA